MLFFLTWADHASVLVDVDGEAAARAAGKEIAGAEPATCALVPPGVVAFQVYLDDEDDEGEGELLVTEPLEHTTAALLALEDRAEDVALSPPPPPLPSEAERCGFELEDDDGAILRCEKPIHVDTTHEAHDARGMLVGWEDAG